MTVQEWAKEFKAFINELQMPRDDYKGIIAYIEDGAKLLKEQEPRVMTLEEVEDALDSVVWVDKPLFDNLSSEYALIDSYSRKLQIVELCYPFYDKDYRERSDYATYGKTWRCWTSRPTDEQREATPWPSIS